MFPGVGVPTHGGGQACPAFNTVPAGVVESPPAAALEATNPLIVHEYPTSFKNDPPALKTKE